MSLATDEAIERVEKRRQGIQDYIITRWDKFNNLLLGGINFASVYIIAGMMGTGKSFVRTLLQEDAFNKELNKDCVIDYVWLHFNFEMVASSELMRIAASRMGLSFYELLSVEKPLDEARFQEFKRILSTLNDLPVYTCNTSGNVYQILATARKAAEKFPDKKLVISIDHSLLVERADEADENRVMAALASTAIRIKQELGAAVIILSQLRTSLQTPQRRTPELQYPVNDDIFGSKQLPQAADFVIILNRPELLNITTYGPSGFPTEGLLAFHITKNRDGDTGMIRMKHDFSKGIIRQWTDQDTLNLALSKS